MSSAIIYHDQFVYVSNSRFFALVDYALEVGKAGAASEQERAYVDALQTKTETFFPGYDLIIEEEFPSTDERKFWARVFFDVAYLRFQGKLGKQDVTFAQMWDVGDAYIIARMITRSVQEEEQGWHPKSMASLEAEAFYNERFKVRF